MAVELRMALLRQHGNFGYAYAATFEPGIEHFGDERGFLSYRTVGNTALVLADPIAPPSFHRELIDRFIAEKHHVSFWCISRPVAEILGTLDFYVNEMGPENRIDLADYDLAGGGKRNLRKSLKRAEKLGYVTRECSFDEIDVAQVKAVSEAWRRTRTIRSREIAFLNRPMVYADEPDVRKLFTFDPDGRIVAFGCFDPVYDQGRVVGYGNQVKRRRPDADPLVASAMICHAISQFRQEGVKSLFLGISPFAEIKIDRDDGFKRSVWVRRCFRGAYRNDLFNRFVYPLRSLHEHKRQYRCVTEQAYFASNERPSLLRILKLLRVCNFV